MVGGGKKWSDAERNGLRLKEMVESRLKEIVGG